MPREHTTCDYVKRDESVCKAGCIITKPGEKRCYRHKEATLAKRRRTCSVKLDDCKDKLADIEDKLEDTRDELDEALDKLKTSKKEHYREVLSIPAAVIEKKRPSLSVIINKLIENKKHFRLKGINSVHLFEHEADKHVITGDTIKELADRISKKYSHITPKRLLDALRHFNGVVIDPNGLYIVIEF